MGNGAPRILVTGGAGFIGASMVRALEARGDQVRILDDGRAAGFDAIAGTAAEVIPDDLLTTDLGVALQGIDGVIHLAAQTVIATSIEQPLSDLRDNVEGTVRLLEAARAAGSPRFILASSSAVLGPSEMPAREADVPAPAVPYGAAKAAAEAYLLAYHATHGMVTTSVRFANAYGPYSWHKSSVIPAFIRHLLGGDPLIVYGDGQQTRDFVHVDDIVRLVLRVLDAPSDDVAGRVFHGGSGRQTSVAQLADVVIRAGRRPGRIEHHSARPGDIAHSSLDISRATEVLGHQPRVELADGVAATIAWFEATGRSSPAG